MYLIKLFRENSRVIVSYRNSGLGDNLLSAAFAWRYAKKTKRSLAIVWSRSQYLANKKQNAFSFFFQDPKSLQGVPIVIENSIDRLSSFILSKLEYLVPFPNIFIILYRLFTSLTIFHHLPYLHSKREKTKKQIIESSRDVKTKVLIARTYHYPNSGIEPFYYSLRLQPEFQKKVDAFAGKFFKGKKVIGVHIRYYNEKMRTAPYKKFWINPRSTLDACLVKINQAVKMLGQPDYVIFLSTDSLLVQDFIMKNVNKVIVYKKSFSSEISKELCQAPPDETTSAAVVEMFLLARSDILVRTPIKSHFSYYASLQAKENIV